MASTVYRSSSVKTVDGVRIYLSPLKLKYLREFMEIFEMLKDSQSDDESMTLLSQCAAVAMQQYYPELSDTISVEDSFDVKSIYKILEYAADIKMAKDEKKEVKENVSSGSSWNELDLAKLESEAFLLGIWKDYEDLEVSLSMPELLATLEAKRELDYQEKKFLAAIQGVDLDKQTGKQEQNAWEKMKAKVFSGGATNDSNDILAYQGVNAQKAGFGIGMGIGYERI